MAALFDFAIIPARMLSVEASLKLADMVDTIGEHKCKQNNVNNDNKEMLTIKTKKC